MRRRDVYDPAEYDDEEPVYATPLARRAVDWGINGSIIAIIILTALYALSPIDALPDVIPVAGQVDDLAAILAGGGSITFLTVLRFLLRSRAGRIGCLMIILLSSIGAVTVFWALSRLFDSLL